MRRIARRLFLLLSLLCSLGVIAYSQVEDKKIEPWRMERPKPRDRLSGGPRIVPNPQPKPTPNNWEQAKKYYETGVDPTKIRPRETKGDPTKRQPDEAKDDSPEAHDACEEYVSVPQKYEDCKHPERRHTGGVSSDSASSHYPGAEPSGRTQQKPPDKKS
jgi:hypothetical protein